MPKIIVSMDGAVIMEVQLTKDRSSIGRRPHNDIVIDNLAVSGEHAVLQISGADVFLEDLSSTNGTFVNGKAIKKQSLQNNDSIEIGKYKMTYLSDVDVSGAERPQASKSAVPTLTAVSSPSAGASVKALIKIMSGVAVDREIALLKVLTTIGKPGLAVAAITQHPQGFEVAHVEGLERSLLNGMPIGEGPEPLKNGDVLLVAGTEMRFVQN
jgi:hypothetical protein